MITPQRQLQAGTPETKFSYQCSALLCAPGGGELADFAQVELAGAEIGQGFEVEELVGARLLQVRQVALGQLRQARP